MNIQIFGARKSFDTKKAERWFKERRIKYQYIDLDSKGLSPGEYRSIRAAVGYDALVDRDSADHPACYPNIETPDGNIDFRRVSNLDTFFRRHAQVLTCELDDPAQWQPGDIVIFGDRDHIGICSDRRNRQGIPFLIHHGNPIDEAVERNDMGKYVITGHFRWMG